VRGGGGKRKEDKRGGENERRRKTLSRREGTFDGDESEIVVLVACGVASNLHTQEGPDGDMRMRIDACAYEDMRMREHQY
jgi:hypothetical protein